MIDPCCGSGIFIDELINKGYSNVYGSDIDAGAIKIARNIVGGKDI